MKVPDNLLFSILQEQEARIKEGLLDKTLEISTGRKYRSISDEPAATYDVLNLKKDIAQLSQHSKNRLFADTALSYVEFNLGKIEDTLRLLYTKAIQAKNQILQEEQLRAVGEVFTSSLRYLLDRVNEKLGQNYLFGGASLTKKAFDENTLEYIASVEDFEVWLTDNYKAKVFLNGEKTFELNVAISEASFTSPDSNFTNSGTLSITVGSTNISLNYSTTQTLTDLVNTINSNYSDIMHAEVGQNPDGSYSLVIAPTRIDDDITVSDASGGDFNTGQQDFYKPNVLQAIKRVGDKLTSGFYTDDSDLILLQRAFERVSLKRSQVGSALSQVKNLQPVQESLSDNLNRQKSDIEDADLAESIMEYTRYKLAYEALMNIIAEQKGITILKYLR
ncbi:MAG: flagellar hook-associated protein 3 [Acidobacteria bacterium]|nr:MAG: flagellar hook-associated protein 3 [Acidobacteriota bacterium]